MTFRRLSLFWKIWLSTSVVLTVLFGFTGFVVQRRALEATSRSLEDEAQASFQAYVSLWRSRAEMLRSLASIISSLPNVRAAFGPRDAATIRDAAQEVWARISDELKEAAFFVVTDPDGNFLASIGEPSPAAVPKRSNLRPVNDRGSERALTPESSARRLTKSPRKANKNPSSHVPLSTEILFRWASPAWLASRSSGRPLQDLFNR